MDQGQNHVTESLLQANPTSFATVSGVEQQNLKATKHSKRIETEEKKERQDIAVADESTKTGIWKLCLRQIFMF